MHGKRFGVAIVAVVALLGGAFIQNAVADSTGESNGNPGNEVSNGSSPQPSGSGSNGESNGNPGNEVSNGATPQPKP